MKKQNNKLKDSELKEMGYQLSDVRCSLESINLINDSLSMLKRYDSEGFLFLINRFLSNQYEQIEKLNKKIDEISFKLQVCDDEDELRSI